MMYTVESLSKRVVHPHVFLIKEAPNITLLLIERLQPLSLSLELTFSLSFPSLELISVNSASRGFWIIAPKA